jgi:hypothetical protein
MLRACRQGLAGLANAGVSQWLDAGFGWIGDAAGWLRASRGPACPRSPADAWLRSAPAGAVAYDIFNENDLQYTNPVSRFRGCEASNAVP